jgi:PAS domain S-box-containing protein
LNLLAQCGTALLVAAATNWVRIREARYQQVAGHVPVVLYSGRFVPGSGNERRSRATAEITLMSAAAQSLLGCPAEQLLGDYQHWLDRVHPDDREILLAALEQLGRQNQPVTCEYRLNRVASGERRVASEEGSPLASRYSPLLKDRWVRDTLAPRVDAAGRLTGWEGVVSEVTEQRNLAYDLRRTTSMFHALVTNLPAGVFFVQGPHGRPILVNARARQLLGQREDPSAGLEHLCLVYRLFRADGDPYPVEDLPVYQALRRGRTAMRDDIVVHHPDGRRVPLVTWAAPVNQSGTGGIDGAVWVMEDLTALRQAEAARKDTESRLRAVIGTMGEGLVVQDRKGCIVDCNPAACTVFNQPADRLNGRSLFDLDWTFLREDGSLLPREDHPTQQVLRTGRPVRNVVLGVQPVRVASGERRVAREEDPSSLATRHASLAAPPVKWLLANAMPLGSGPAPVGAVTTFSDVTAYIQAQRQTHLSEERYRGLVEDLPLMLAQADRDLRVTYVNPALKEQSGYGLEEIAGPDTWSRLVHPDDLPRLRAKAQEALEGRSGCLEIRYRAKDGKDLVAYALIQPTFQDGQVVGVLTLLIDITRGG